MVQANKVHYQKAVESRWSLAQLVEIKCNKTNEMHKFALTTSVYLLSLLHSPAYLLHMHIAPFAVYLITRTAEVVYKTMMAIKMTFYHRWNL